MTLLVNVYKPGVDQKQRTKTSFTLRTWKYQKVYNHWRLEFDRVLHVLGWFDYKNIKKYIEVFKRLRSYQNNFQLLLSYIQDMSLSYVTAVCSCWQVGLSLSITALLTSKPDRSLESSVSSTRNWRSSTSRCSVPRAKASSIPTSSGKKKKQKSVEEITTINWVYLEPSAFFLFFSAHMVVVA